MKNRAYKIMTTKDPIQIDVDELPKLVKSIMLSQAGIFRKGILNPSYFIGLVEDRERIENWYQDFKHDKETLAKGLPLLPDIFDVVDMNSLVKNILNENNGENPLKIN